MTNSEFHSVMKKIADRPEFEPFTVVLQNGERHTVEHDRYTYRDGTMIIFPKKPRFMVLRSEDVSNVLCEFASQTA